MPGLIPPATLEQIRAANDIVDVIGSYFPLKRAGANFTALCPFHKEKTPSFNVSPARQFFHCFGCQKGGDVFKFVEEYENLPFVDAVRRLAERARIPLEFDNRPGQAQERHIKERLLDVHEQLTRRWHACLKNEANGEVARNYLIRRGVSEEAVDQFRLGFAPDAWDDTVNWSKSKGYELDLVEKGGLILRKESTDRYYDRFRGRLIFPITDVQGRVIGFSGRLLDEEAKAAKYVNSPETLIFHKSRVFFGLNKALRAVLDAGSAIVCEGQLDMMACYMAGIQNVVAPQGTAFTPDHARILKRYASEIVFCFDADTAGQNAAIRSLDSFLPVDLAARVASIPAPHDPDTFIREFGADAFSDLIRNAPGFFDFYLDHLTHTNELTSDRGRMAILKGMAEAVHKTHNEVLIDTYAQKTAQRLGVSAAAVMAEFQKQGRPRHAQARRQANDAASEPAPVSEPLEPLSSAESWLLKILFQSDDFVEWIRVHLDMKWIRHDYARTIIQARMDAQTGNHWQGLAAFLHQLDDPRHQQVVTESASSNRAIPDPERTLKGDINRPGLLTVLRNDYIDRELRHLQQLASRTDLPEEEIERIETEKAQLRKLKMEAEPVGMTDPMPHAP